MDNNIEVLLNSQISASLIVGIMVKVLMVLLLILSLVILRQARLMDRVVKLPVGKSIKLFVWSFFVLMCILTGIVILV